ncbi:MAG: restriction endonuclease [Caldilineales bacterium]|nr:restriction endonuclease [Caldilineales bacterium]MCW5858138.1 restriction endonuclease [Caldilineales bacterium]
MTYLDAAYTILQTAGQPLHYEEITQRALAQGLIQPSGLTPAATMGSRLYTDTKQDDSQFVRAGHGRFGLAQWQPKGIDAHVEEINAATRGQLAQLIATLPPERFEALIRELLIQMGFDENTVKTTPYSGDGGIDVTGVYRAAGLTNVSAAVQVKRWKGNVGAPVVTQLRGSLEVHQQGIIITTSDFSKSAREEASAPNKTRIGLINGKELIDLLIKHRVGVVKRTLEVTALDDEYWGELAGAGAGATAPIQPEPPQPAIGETTRPKPRGFTLLGEHYTAKSWRDALLTACTALAAHHGPAFAEAAFTVKGRTRQYVAASPDGMITPAQISGTELWVEANQSAKSVVQVIEKLLAALGHEAGELAITF